MTYPILALDVAGKLACACLIDKKGRVFTAEAEEGKQHSDAVLPLLDHVLKQADLTWADLGMLAMGQGPGSFTGLRIAAATLAGINAAQKLPVWGFSSLAITAMQTCNPQAIWVLEDARAGEVFAGLYQNGQALRDDVCMAWSDVEALNAKQFASQQEPAISLPAWQRLPLQISRAQAMAELILVLYQYTDHTAHSSWVEPVYLQLSQAERNLQHG